MNRKKNFTEETVTEETVTVDFNVAKALTSLSEVAKSMAMDRALQLRTLARVEALLVRLADGPPKVKERPAELGDLSFAKTAAEAWEKKQEPPKVAGADSMVVALLDRVEKLAYDKGRLQHQWEAALLRTEQVLASTRINMDAAGEWGGEDDENTETEFPVREDTQP